jgi:KaiC/GvpD/RAD55 family RecA-like ATPase
LAQHFIDTGLRAGENCLLLSIKNTPEQILAQAQSLQMDWTAAYHNGNLLIRHHDPATLCVEEMIDSLVRDIHTARPRRLVLDSIDDLWTAVKDEDRVLDYVLVLAALFEAGGTTSMVLNEIRQLGGAQAGDVQDYGYLANSVIRLTSTAHKDWVRRVIAVAKHAGSDHSKQIVDYHIDKNGFRVVGHTPVAAVTAAAPSNPGVLPPPPPVRRVTNAGLPDVLPAPRRMLLAVPDAVPAPVARETQRAETVASLPVRSDPVPAIGNPDGSSSGSTLR